MTADRLVLPPFKALLAFHAAARHDRLIDAAASLGVTESAVSHQIRNLEDQLRMKLFERESGRLVLTETGRIYLARIEPALNEIQAATRAIRPETGRGVVRLTLPTSMAVTWLLPRLGGFEAANPDVDVQLIPTTRVVDLLRDQVDLAIRYGRGSWAGMEATFLFDDLATPVAAPGLVDAPVDDIASTLSGMRFIVNRSIPDEWQEWARARNIDLAVPADALAFDSIEQVLQVAEAGHGLAMGRSPYIEERLQRGTLVAPFGAADPTGAAYYVCHPASVTPTAPAKRVIRWLFDEASALKAD
ncbi:MAG: LysR substrate-binding domain-containing protein [Pseudomonadota bacterium]